jgi:YfiH family protein
MWSIEQTAVGRIAVPPVLPAGFAVFCTTIDFPGFLDDDAARALTGVVRDRFGIDATLATCNQVHGATVTRAPSAKAWQECDSCDALWTGAPNHALAIKIADCLPVTLIDPEHRAIANIHSGWRGAAQRITAAALDTLERESSFRATTAVAYLGPSIRVCCFEVGEEVVDELARAYGDIAPFVDRTKTKPHVDLTAVTAALLRERGVAQVHDSGLCTRCEGSIFHSYRRGGRGSGRNLAVAAM